MPSPTAPVIYPTLYVKNETGVAITANAQYSPLFELQPKDAPGDRALLPWSVAVLPGFLKIWGLGKVTVATDLAFANVITELPTPGSGSSTVTSDNITDASTVGKNVLKAADATAARTAIGAGTATVGSVAGAALAAAGAAGTATTAARSDHVHPLPPNATTGVKGLVNQAAAQVNSTATDAAGAVVDLNALLTKLRTAGILAP